MESIDPVATHRHHQAIDCDRIPEAHPARCVPHAQQQHAVVCQRPLRTSQQLVLLAIVEIVQHVEQYHDIHRVERLAADVAIDKVRAAADRTRCALDVARVRVDAAVGDGVGRRRKLCGPRARTMTRSLEQRRQ